MDDKEDNAWSHTILMDFSALRWLQIMQLNHVLAIFKTYPEIDDSRFRCVLWIFKHQLTLKVWARCGNSNVL